jgi:hypothetical protein
MELKVRESMRTTQSILLKGVFATLAVFLVMFALPPLGQARKGGIPERDLVNVGIPSAPKQVRSVLPELRPDAGIDLNILRLHPYFSSSVQFDDNITLAETDEKDDGIFTETPALSFEMDIDDHHIAAGYGMEIVEFVKDQEENAVNHFAFGSVELNFGDLTLYAEDKMERSTNRSFSETSARDKVLLNSIQLGARYDRPNWAGEFDWTHNRVNHLTDGFDPNDYNEDLLTFLAGYKVRPKTLLLGEFDWGTVYYDRNESNADANYIRVLTGIRGEPTDDIAANAKIGYEGRWFHDADAATGDPNTLHNLIVDADVSYRVTEDDRLRAGYLRGVRTSTFGDNSAYRQDKLYLSYQKRMWDKVYVTPQASFQHNDYSELGTISGTTKERGDYYWSAGLKVQYRLQDWVWATARYDYRTRNSNFDTLDYWNNRVTLDLTFSY